MSQMSWTKNICDLLKDPNPDIGELKMALAQTAAGYADEITNMRSIEKKIAETQGDEALEKFLEATLPATPTILGRTLMLPENQRINFVIRELKR